MSPLWQLLLMRLRSMTREPGTLFWVFIFPLLTSLALGLAFRRQTTAELPVAVVLGDGADAEALALEAVEGLTASVRPELEGRRALQTGEISLLLKMGTPPALTFDPARIEGRTAKLLVLRELETRKSERHDIDHTEEAMTAPGSRYVDFVIPGMLGFGLMSSGIWGLGYGLVQMRKGKLLKRFAATPMRRTDFLLSFVLSRMVIALAEVLFFAFFARVLFDVPMFGSTLVFLVVGLTGALAFAAMALLVGSRAENTETASGLANLIIMPMMILSGVFFSVSHFPAWLQPFIALLPLTALNDALRGVMLGGKGFVALTSQFLVLGIWGAVSFAAALRWFRWT